MGVRTVATAAVLGVLLAGCGYKGAVTRLVPPDPALSRDEQKAARAAERREVEAGLSVPATARPIRVDELTVKLEVRRDDPFSLPPEGTQMSRKVPFPGEEGETNARPLPMPAAEPNPGPATEPTPDPER